jgi:hypothetical protein
MPDSSRDRGAPCSAPDAAARRPRSDPGGSELLPLFDLAIWLEIAFDRALERALERDAVAMGGPIGVRERYPTRYFPGQRGHLARDRPREQADLVLAVR